MNDSKIAVRYAKALFKTAVEKKDLAAITRDIQFLQATIDSVELFNWIMESPVIQTSKKQQTFNLLFNEIFHPLTIAFLDMVALNKRENCMKAIVRDFLDFYRAHAGIKKAVIETAYKIDDLVKQEIVSIIKVFFKAEIELVEKTNPELIGGFVLRVEDQQIDASILTKLNRIKRELV